MAYPPSYTRGFDFTDWSESRPDESLPGDRVDTELDNIQTALMATQSNLALIQRADGRLANESVGVDQLEPDLLSDIAAQVVVDGEMGPAGPMGAAGPAGLVGPAGPALPWIVSTGVPAAEWGDLGQVYLNVSNGDVWQKAPGGWTLLGNIRGAPGIGTGTGVGDHGALTGLTDPDHPIAAIQGLQAILDGIGAQLAVLSSGSLKTYRQPDAPTASLNAGDLWIETDNQNRLYRWDGIQWVDVSDARAATALAQAGAAITAAAGAQATADGKVTTYVLPSAPAVPQLGDLWFESDNGMKLRRWNGTTWLDVSDAGVAEAIAIAADAQATADGKIVTYYQPTAPVGAGLGDLWFDTDDNNQMYRFNGANWVSTRDALIQQAYSNAATAIAAAATAQATADGNIDVFYQSNPPIGAALGDLWVDSDDKQLYRWNGSAWASIRDSGIAAAVSDSALAVATADSKIRSYFATTAPVGAALGDLWFDTDDNYRPYRWTGSAWQDVTPISGVTGGQVTGVSIANGVVTAAKLAAGSVTADKIAAGAITADKIAAGAITATNIAAGTITADRVVAGSFDSTVLAAGAARNVIYGVETTPMSLVISSGVNNTLIAAPITTLAGTPVKIDFACEIGFPNAPQPWGFELLRNGVSLSLIARRVNSGDSVTLWWIDVPGAGTHTYTVRQVYHPTYTTTTASGQAVGNRYLSLDEARR